MVYSKPIKYPYAGEAYAIFDSSNGSLKFFRDDEGKYTNGQTDGTKTYYTDIETTNYASQPAVPWYSLSSDITSVTFEDKIKPRSTAYWFNGFDNALFTSITDLNKLDTSSVTNMNSMFYGCANLTSLDLSNFNTSNVTNMSSMFKSCTTLTSLDLSSFNTINVTVMGDMFYNCSSLTSLNLSSFNTNNLMYMGQMFYNCSSLTSLDLSNFDTSNAMDMYSIFYGCSALTTIYVSNTWDVSGVIGSTDMFLDCTNLVGGQGTTYNSSYTDKTRAIIDGGSSNPGYLTYKAVSNNS